MDDLFLKVVQTSLSASWLIAAAVAVRLLLKKAPKWTSVLLWGIVALRLICPVALESVFSLVPRDVSSGAVIMEWSETQVEPIIFLEAYAGGDVAPQTENDSQGVALDIPVVPDDAVQQPAEQPDITLMAAGGEEPETVGNTVVPVLAVIWLAGMAGLFLYSIVSYFRLYSRVRTAVRLQNNIYQSEFAASPFVLGLVRPRIYLPFSVGEQNLSYVVAHERAHIARGDHWWKPLGFLLLTIHWFNPLMWLGYVLLCRDIEYACDEKVIGELGREQRADYSQALLICGAHSRMKYACPVAFGEVGVKERVKNVLNYKKPGIWITVAAVTAVIVAAVCFLTAPPVEAEGIPETTETMADTTAAAQDTTAPSTETESSDNVEGYLYVDNVTGSGLQLYCKTRGEAWHKVTACGPYRLEKKTESGWEELPVKLGDATWAPITYEYYGLDVIDWPVNWVALYGVLPEGTYRLWTQPLENEPEYSVAFEITASEDQQIRDAAARCTAALQALLDKESYALYYFHTTELELSRLPADKFIGEEYSEDHIQIYKSGEDFLEFQLREEDGTLRVVDGKMKKNGVKYRLDNEEEGNSRTPVAGWSQWPDVEDGRFTWWVSSASFVQANILSDPETYSISDGEVTFRMQPMNSPMMWYTQLGQVYTFRFDENGELKSVTIVTEGTDYGGFDVDVTYTTVLTVDSVNDPAIAEKIAAQDVNFYRSFSWEEERALYEVTAEYKNVAQTSVSTAPEAIALAKNECDVAYTKIVVYRDEAAGMWKVEFQRHYGYQGYYNVYLGNDGITRLIAMGEAKHS